MYATNRVGSPFKQHKHVIQLWTTMREDAHKNGESYLCAYVETDKGGTGEVEAIFADL